MLTERHLGGDSVLTRGERGSNPASLFIQLRLVSSAGTRKHKTSQDKSFGRNVLHNDHKHENKTVILSSSALLSIGRQSDCGSGCFLLLGLNGDLDAHSLKKPPLQGFVVPGTK